MYENVRRTVRHVTDGDTFEIARELLGTHFIRLAGVIAPEKGTMAGSIATNTLRGLIGGKTVTIRPKGRSYNRIVAVVFYAGRNINAVMRNKGYR